MLCVVLLQVSSFGDHPLLQPAAAQLANAMVAVLGPQFTLGSLAYSRCKTLVTDNTGVRGRWWCWNCGGQSRGRVGKCGVLGVSAESVEDEGLRAPFVCVIPHVATAASTAADHLHAL